MKRTISTADFSEHLFWDVDIALFDFDKHKAYLIQKVLQYGTIQDWELLKKFYGLETIKEVSMNLRDLDAVTLSYLSTIFDIDKTEFRCYKHRQLYPNLWNS